jgi:hypothetical protein
MCLQSEVYKKNVATSVLAIIVCLPLLSLSIPLSRPEKEDCYRGSSASWPKDCWARCAQVPLQILPLKKAMKAMKAMTAMQP